MAHRFLQPSAIPFVPGHVLYRKAIRAGKAKNDCFDAHKIAVSLRGGTLSMAYVDGGEMRRHP